MALFAVIGVALVSCGSGSRVTSCGDVAEPLSREAVEWFIDEGVTPSGAQIIVATCGVEERDDGSLTEIRDAVCARLYCGADASGEWAELDTN